MKNYLHTFEPFLEDVRGLVTKGHEKYGDSCLKRGSVGLFMMLARKWDRIEKAMGSVNYDLDQAVEDNPAPDGLLDDFDDLITYLVILRADYIARRNGHEKHEQEMEAQLRQNILRNNQEDE